MEGSPPHTNRGEPLPWRGAKGYTSASSVRRSARVGMEGGTVGGRRGRAGRAGREDHRNNGANSLDPQARILPRTALQRPHHACIVGSLANLQPKRPSVSSEVRSWSSSCGSLRGCRCISEHKSCSTQVQCGPSARSHTATYRGGWRGQRQEMPENDTRDKNRKKLALARAPERQSRDPGAPSPLPRNLE